MIFLKKNIRVQGKTYECRKKHVGKEETYG
jgi:hypothetical protein